VGDFSIAPPEGTIRPGMSYRFRMIGLGESGQVYESPDNDSSKYPLSGEVCDKDKDNDKDNDKVRMLSISSDRDSICSL